MFSLPMSPGPTSSSAPEWGPAPSGVAEEVAALLPLARGVVCAVLREAPGHPDVEDATHEVLRRAMEGPSGVQQARALRPWVVGIARHVALDVLRARKKQRAREAPRGLRTPGGEADESRPDLVDVAAAPAEESPHDELERARTREALARALESLPEGSREALVLFHVEGLSYQAIAARMSVPVGTVATWILRGRRALAALLDAEDRP